VALVRTEVRRGHAAGNHTWDHPDLVRLSGARQASQMSRTTAEQRRITGTAPCAFRPPYGNYNATTLRLAQQRHMKVWLWSVDTEDWKARGSGSSYWVQRIVRLAEQQGGALRHPVVLMHNQTSGNPATVAALPTIIKYFRSHGYRFVTL
jgi:peptidoglycan/xylan/chitin deacetylase (PgdA/CDA1 family)